jgi:hypothetical protein
MILDLRQPIEKAARGGVIDLVRQVLDPRTRLADDSGQGRPSFDLNRLAA